MKPTKKIYGLLAIAFLLLPVAAKAEGFYVIGALGPTDEGLADTDATSVDGSFGHVLTVGKHFGDSLAVELFHANPAASDSVTGEGGDAVTEAEDLTSIGLALKWYRDFSDTTKGFVKFGYHSWDYENVTTDADGEVVLNSDGDGPYVDPESGTDLLWGVGVEYQFNDNLSFVGGYDIYTIGLISSVNLLNFGVKYSF